jgi:hypothetical protein
MKKNYYIQFLNLLKALEQTSESPKIDVTSKLILDEVAIGVAKDEMLTVSDVMGLKHIGSPATLHRKLNMLIEAHMVDPVFQGNNRRTKYIALTNEGESYFRRLSDAIQMTRPSHG